MRVDKFLKVSRIIKRRTIANEACDAGRVSINGKVVKAGASKAETEVDGVTGATLTSVGVSDMVQDGLSVYLSFINN